ncbi:MAG: hypothetical protein RLZZ519_1571 [Bacteroidota bacterium]|jgi:hypothetical protein
MRKVKSHLSLLALVLVFGGLHAQFELQPTLLRSHVWSQTYQPANIMEGEYESFRYGAIGTGWLGNTHAPLKGVFAENGYIEDTTKNRLIGDLRAKEDISAGYHLGLAAVNFKIGDQRIGIYLDEYNTAYFRFNEPKTLGLVLKGNGPYAGDTVSDSGIRGNLARVRELAVGTGWKWDQLSFGARIRLKQGIRMANLDHLNYSLFTETNGTQVQLAADYDLSLTPKLAKTGLFAFQGFGAGLDLGMRYELNEKLDFDFAVTDLGFTSWKTNQIADEVNVNWEGFSVTSLFMDSVSTIIQDQVDSIKGVLLPDTIEGRTMLMAPMSIRASATFHLNEQANLSGTIVWNPIASGAPTRLPLISVAYQHELIEGLTLGANAYGLGLDTYGFGAMANYQFSVGSASFDILAGSDNLLGLIAPGIGRGMSVYGGVGVGF